MRKLTSMCFVVVAVTSVACVPGSSPIHIVGTFPASPSGTECMLDADVSQTRGRLDASGGGDFLIVLGIVSELNADKQILSADGVELTGPAKHNFVVDAVALTYRSTNPVIQFVAEQIPTYFEVRPVTDDNRLATDIIGDKAAETLRTQLTDPMQVTQLTVNVQLRGHLNSGESVTSNTIAFPIEVRTSNTACPEPGNVTFSGPCGVRGGQDGSTFACCTAPGIPAMCP